MTHLHNHPTVTTTIVLKSESYEVNLTRLTKAYRKTLHSVFEIECYYSEELFKFILDKSEHKSIHIERKGTHIGHLKKDFKIDSIEFNCSSKKDELIKGVLFITVAE